MTVRVRQKQEGDCRSFAIRFAADGDHDSCLCYDFMEGLLTFDRSRSGYVDDAMAPRKIASTIMIVPQPVNSSMASRSLENQDMMVPTLF